VSQLPNKKTDEIKAYLCDRWYQRKGQELRFSICMIEMCKMIRCSYSESWIFCDRTSFESRLHAIGHCIFICSEE